MNYPVHPSVQTQHATARRDDEISLLDMWEILVRRKFWVIVSFVVCLVASSGYLLIAPPVYEVSAKLRIGQVADSGDLEDPEVLAAWFLGKYGEEMATGIKRPPPFLKRISVQKGSKQIVDLVVHGDSAEQSAEFLRRVTEEAISRHRETYMSEVELTHRRIEQIESHRKLLSELFAGAGDLIETLRQRDPVQASLLTLERGRIAAEISTADSELPEWIQKLNAPKTVMTEVLGGITAPARPASPKTALVIALASVLGVISGVMLAFVAEFLVKMRKTHYSVRHD